MILDRVENFEQYFGVHMLFPAVAEYIAQYLKKPVDPGVYEIYGQDLFVKVQNYETRDSGFLEVHDRYIDVQYVVEGEEMVEYDAREGLETAVYYDTDEDVLFLRDSEQPQSFRLKQGDIAIFFFNDAHKPALRVQKPTRVKKLVFKVKLLQED